MKKQTGAEVLVAALQSVGVKVLGGIPGHTNYDLADAALTSPLRNVVFRHETAATFAADVYFRCTGSLMAVFVHSIPGLSNAMAGIANAYADSSAMIVLVGGTASANLGRGAYQEFSRQFDDDVPQLLRHAVKRVFQPRTVDQIPGHITRAAIAAVEGRPGPVALHIPQELLSQELELPEIPPATDLLSAVRGFRPSADAVQRAAELLAAAERPLIVAGHGVHVSGAEEELLRLAEARHIPVATSVSGKSVFPNAHPLSLGVIGWVGTKPANHAGRNADVVLFVGARISESTTSSWQPGVSFDFLNSSVIQADIDTASFGHPYRADVALLGDAALTLRDLLEAGGEEPSASRREWVAQLQAEVAAWDEMAVASQRVTDWPVPVGAVVAALRQAIEEPVTIVSDVGKAHKWLVQQFESRPGDYLVSSIGGGTMGIGAGGAIGAALADPGRRVVSWMGDGGMSMSLSCLPTAAELKLPIAFVVLDDNAYGAVTNVQDARYEGRLSYSVFDGGGVSPGYHLDLVGAAQACGLQAHRLQRADELPEAIAQVTAFDGPRMLVVPVERNSVAPSGGGSKLSAPWEADFLTWSLEQASRPSLQTR